MGKCDPHDPYLPHPLTSHFWELIGMTGLPGRALVKYNIVLNTSWVYKLRRGQKTTETSKYVVPTEVRKDMLTYLIVRD